MSVSSFVLNLFPAIGSLMGAVVFNSLLVVIGTTVVTMFLRFRPIHSPRATQWLWLLVLVPGIAFFHVPIQIATPSSGQRPTDNLRRVPSSDLDVDSGRSTESSTVSVRLLDSDRDETFGVQTEPPTSVAAIHGSRTQLSPLSESSPVLSKQDEATLGRIPSAASPASALSVSHQHEQPAKTANADTSSFVAPAGMPDRLPAVDTLLLIAWCAGAGFVVLLSIYRIVAFRRTLTRDRVDVPESSSRLWLQEWDSVCDDLKIRRGPEVCFSRTLGPGLCPGITRARLVIPVAFWESLDATQREAVLRHEAAHLVRKDLWRSFLIRLLALPHWFNPCVWLAVRRFDEAAEWACDEMALSHDQQNKCDFAALLVDLATGSNPQPVVFGQQLVRRHSLSERVRRLVSTSPDSRDNRFSRLTLLAFPLLLVAASVVEVRLVAQSTPPTITADRDQSAVTSAPASDQPTKSAAVSPDSESPAEAKTPEGDDSKPRPPETTVAKDDPQATPAEAAETLPPDPIPSLPGFQFAPWYELDENRLWQQIGWKVTLKHLPEDINAFVTMMQSPQFQNEALDLSRDVIVSLGINRLKELPNIEALNLAGGIPATENQLKSIAQLPHLRKLDLSRLRLIADDLSHLADAKKLQSLRLHSSEITGHAFKNLGNLVSLEELYLGDMKLPQWSTRRDLQFYQLFPLRYLSRLSKLRVLQIDANEAGSIEAFDFLPQLETLHLPRGRRTRTLDDSEFEALSRLSKLRQLHLPHPPGLKQIDSLRPLTRLRMLTFPTEFDDLDKTYAEIRRQLPGVRSVPGYGPTLKDQTTINFSDLPLKDGLDFLSTSHDIPIFIDKPALDEIGITPAERIDLVLTGTSLRSVLRIMLTDLRLEAVMHRDGLTVTTHDGNRLHLEEYELSEVLQGVEAGDNLTAQLARTLKKIITPEVWGKQFTRLPTKDSAEGEVETGIAEIRSIGTTLSVLAPARSHAGIDQIVRQISHDEQSRLLDVELKQMIDRHPGKFSFADSPLIDCVTYISRSYDCPIIIDCIGLEEAGILIDEPVTRDFEVTTLADGLDKLLTPLKLTWIYQDEVFKVVTQASDAARPTLFVHQLDDGLLAPKHPLEKEDWLNQLRSICSFAMGTRKLRFEVWFNRLIVYEPWRSQYRLSRKLDEMLYHPNRQRRLNGSVRKSD